MRLSESEAIAHYTRIIQKEFSLPEDEAKQWAVKFFGIVDSKGGDPYETEGMEKHIRIVIGSWIQIKK